MSDERPTPNMRPASTTWEWRKVRVRPAPSSPASRRAKRGLLTWRNWREPLTVQLTFRGGAEQWVEVRARGAVIRRPGHIAIVDVLALINGMSQEGWSETENGR